VEDLGGKMSVPLNMNEPRDNYGEMRLFMRQDTAHLYCDFEPLVMEARMKEVTLEKIPYVVVYDIQELVEPGLDGTRYFTQGTMKGEIYLFDLRDSRLLRHGNLMGMNNEKIKLNPGESSRHDFLETSAKAAAKDLEKEMRDAINLWILGAAQPPPKPRKNKD
jgi:hypothetical protein